MRLFLYKCLIVFISIYILYNFTIGKKIDEYEKKMFQIGTDKGREEIRDLIRKEIKNTIDNDYVFDPEDRIIIKKLVDKIKNELGY